MTEMGWIIIATVAVMAIILAIVLLRRKGSSDTLSHEPAPADLLPEQVSMPIGEPERHAKTRPVEAAIAVASSASIPTETPAIAKPVIVAPAAVEPEPESAPLSPEPIRISTPPVHATAVAASNGEGDNLLRLKGVGPKIANLLKAEGVTRYAQIAGWNEADLAAIDAKLGSFSGRPKRDNWVDQAQLLAAGDVAGYEAKYGKL